jgi:glycosyltransferase involved in cell wall biosynthesis
MLGDSPLLTTGFGRVQRNALEAFLEAGWEVASVTALQTEEKPCDIPNFTQYVPEQGDNMGVLRIAEAVEDFKPDVIFATSEPGGITALAMFSPASVPFVAYTVVEGEPIGLDSWRTVMRKVHPLACSEYGQRVLKRDTGVDAKWAYHGVDHDTFYPDTEKREATRKLLGWTDKFIVMTVAQNVRRKQHPRLFEAIRQVRTTFKQKDVMLYDHTVPFMKHWLDGWHLPQISDSMGLHDVVMFNPSMTEFGAHIPEVNGGAGLPGLADLYRAADLFVLPSQVEGFGLPIAEAMASGTPVVVTKYAAGWEVASPAGVGIPVYDWELAKSGVKYANISPAALAKIIVDLKRDPKRLARMSAAGVERARDFDWGKFKEAAVDACKDAAQAPEGERPVQGQEALGI